MNKKFLKSNNIFDVDTKSTFSGVLEVTGNRITLILDELPANIDGAEVIDYHDKMIIPGFIDPHQHINKASMFYAHIMQFISGSSAREVASQVVNLSVYHGFKVASGFYTTEFSESKVPTRVIIDQFESKVPTLLLSGDGHTAWINSAALAKVHVSDEDVAKFGGNAYKDETGALTGFFEEGISVHVVGQIFTQMEVERPQIYLDYIKYMNTMGITGLADMASTGSADDDFIYEDVYTRIADQVSARISIFPAYKGDTRRFDDIRTRLIANERVLVGGGKQFYDGVTSTETAYLKAPYPNSDVNVGSPLIPNEKLRQLILNANENGWPIRVHAIGDEAIKRTLTYFAEADKKYPLPKGKYNTIEHLEVFDPEDIDLIRETKAIVSVQPSHALLGYDTLEEEVGAKRAAAMFPTKDFLAVGAELAFGTDAPVVLDTTPLQSIFNATTRRTYANLADDSFRPEQAISTADALVAHTLGAAHAIQRLDIGAIKVGNFADLTILDTNILEIKATDLLNVKVVTTIFNGEVVYNG